jgi:RecB family exonuclease
VEGGLATLTGDLPRWVDEDPPPAARRAAAGSEADAARRRAFVGHAVHLGRLVRALERESSGLRRSADWPGFAAAARALLEGRLDGFARGDAADPATRGVLAAVDDLEALGAAEIPFESPAAALAALERAVAAGRVPLDAFAADGTGREADEGGVRVFDMMQARGLSFDTVILLGLNAGQTPRPARPDPFLPDSDRARLRAALGRPLPIKEDARLEEHLLLALTLGSARRRLVVGWQRADDSGRAVSSSLALREIGRITRGSPDLAMLLHEADRVPGDLRSWGRAEPASSLLPQRDALLAAGMAAGSPAALLPRLEALAPLLPGDSGAYAAGLEHLGALESPDDRGFDALVGPPDPAAADPAAAIGAAESPRPWSPSRLEMLGACPQRYFFRHLLHLEEWEEIAEAHAIDPREIGSAVHDVLARLSDAAIAPDPSAAPRPLAEEVRAAWREVTVRIAGRLDPIYPGLWEQIGGAWREAVVRFVERDWPALRAEGGRLLCEASVEASLPVPGRDGALRLTGRFDRLHLHADGRVVVTDYKTGGGLEEFVAPREFLKGRRLQMPLYALMAAAGRLRGSGEEVSGERASIAVEVLGVGPRFEREPDEARAVLEAAVLDATKEGFLETLAVLLRLGDAGLYPLNETPFCTFCEFRRACRRGHPATLDRLANNPALRDYALLRRKSSRAKLLAQVARDAGGEEP